MKYPLCFLGWLTGIVLIRVFPHRSLLAAIGVLLFAGFSLVLLALFARFVARRLKSRRRGVRWGLIGGAVLLVLALFVLQRLNTPGDKVEIEKTIEAVTTGANPYYCETEVTSLPFVALALFFTVGGWWWFLLIPAAGALLYGGKHSREGHADRER